MEYDFKKLEKKWKKYWDEKEVFKTDINSQKEKFYLLDMFPYPSGEGLHVGHPKGYIATDILAHYYRLNNFEVLHPMGWDAFGLPAENYAIKTGNPPAEITQKNIANFKRQLQSLGLSYDWSREIDTTDPNYFKWTQWIFIQLFNKGLAYQAELPINFCPSCKTGLANEEVKDGKCDRCGADVERKKIRQWVLKITEYADRLLEDLKGLDWPEPIKSMQSNWISRSEGATVKFEIVSPLSSRANEESREIPFQKSKGSLRFGRDDKYIPVFTTRADTLFGCTYIVVSPEKAKEYGLENEKTRKYIDEALNKLDRDRLIEEKEKTGVDSGFTAINPVNSKEIPIFIADYVLSDYATGAIMAVPAHDQRDFLFAKKFGLPVVEVVRSNKSYKTDRTEKLENAYEEYGALVNSEKFDGMDSEKAKVEITKWLKEKGLADWTTNYKLRDWVFSRQRYWGEPMPLVFCENCKKQVEIQNLSRAKPRDPKSEIQNDGEKLNPGWTTIDEKDLPLTLPELKNYQPTGNGNSPLTQATDWVNTTCPKCGGPAKRETNTMPQWAGSCWYYIAYLCKQNSKFQIQNPKLLEKWLPVDFYIGGAEHAVLHLLYARFWHKVLYDIGVVKCPEPFQKLRNVGLILAADGQKMSKSLGNVVNPDDVIDYYGADCYRIYEMFLGPFEETGFWQTKGINGVDRFLKRFWNNLNIIISKKYSQTDEKVAMTTEKLIQKASIEIPNMHFNVVIAGFMELNNLISEKTEISIDDIKRLMIIFAPLAPIFTEEIWSLVGEKESIFKASWPEINIEKIKSQKQIIAIQVNGKLRGSVEVNADSAENIIKEAAAKEKNIAEHLKNKKIIKTIYITGKIINFVIQ